MERTNSADTVISVIIPVFNKGKYLARALDSVLAQTFSAWEIILVDDGSTDASSQICDNYSKKDPRIHVVHTKNRGVSSARNTGLQLASGIWIQFLDSDDYIAPNMMERLLSVSGGFDWIVCGSRLFTVKNELIRSYPAECSFNSASQIKNNFYKIGTDIMYVVWQGIYRKSAVRHIFNENYLHEEDMLFNIEFLNYCEGLYILPDVLYNHQMDIENSLDRRFWSDTVEHCCEIYMGLKNYLGELLNRNSKIIQNLIGKALYWMYHVNFVSSCSDEIKIIMLQLALENQLFKKGFVPSELLLPWQQRIWNCAAEKDLKRLKDLLWESRIEAGWVEDDIIAC